MKSATKSAADAAQLEQLVERIADLARALELHWEGPGGAFLLEAPGQHPCWRVYSEWAGDGVTADVEPESGELFCIEDARAETAGTPLKIPAAMLATPSEVAEFVRTKVELVGWPWPAEVVAHWDDAAQIWRVSNATLADDNQSLWAEVRARRQRLKLTKLARRRPAPATPSP